MPPITLTEAETENILALAGTEALQGLKGLLESLAQQKRTSVVDILCQTHDQSQVGPLHKAVMSGNLEVFDYIIESLNVLLPHRPGLHKSAVNAQSAVGTPLLLAAKNNHTHIAQKLLDLGASPLIPDPFAGWLALHHAANHNQLYLTYILLDKDGSGAHINARTRSAETPLLLACRNNHNNIASLLIRRGTHDLDKGAHDASGESAMHHAARAHNLSLARRLGRAGAPTGLRNSQGQTPYDVARAGWFIWRDVDIVVAEEFRGLMDELDALELAAEMAR